MPRSKKTIALIFPVNVGYSQLLTAGVIERHPELRNWNFINLPRHTAGISPLPEGNFPINGAIVWTEPRDVYGKELAQRGIPVINCGVEWANECDRAGCGYDREGEHRGDLWSHDAGVDPPLY